MRMRTKLPVLFPVYLKLEDAKGEDTKLRHQ